MKIRKTSFAITKDTRKFEELLLQHMDIPRTVFHRRMIDYYFKNNIEVNPYLLVAERKNPNFVRRSISEQIYLDEEREAKLQDEAEKYGCRIGVILFQAMMSYCIAIAPSVLGAEEFEQLFEG